MAYAAMSQPTTSLGDELFPENKELRIQVRRLEKNPWWGGEQVDGVRCELARLLRSGEDLSQASQRRICVLLSQSDLSAAQEEAIYEYLLRQLAVPAPEEWLEEASTEVIEWLASVLRKIQLPQRDPPLSEAHSLLKWYKLLVETTPVVERGEPEAMCKALSHANPQIRFAAGLAVSRCKYAAQGTHMALTTALEDPTQRPRVQAALAASVVSLAEGNNMTAPGVVARCATALWNIALRGTTPDKNKLFFANHLLRLVQSNAGKQLSELVPTWCDELGEAETAGHGGASSTALLLLEAMCTLPCPPKLIERAAALVAGHQARQQEGDVKTGHARAAMMARLMTGCGDLAKASCLSEGGEAQHAVVRCLCEGDSEDDTLKAMAALAVAAGPKFEREVPQVAGWLQRHLERQTTVESMGSCSQLIVALFDGVLRPTEQRSSSTPTNTTAASAVADTVLPAFVDHVLQHCNADHEDGANFVPDRKTKTKKLTSTKTKMNEKASPQRRMDAAVQAVMAMLSVPSITMSMELAERCIQLSKFATRRLLGTERVLQALLVCGATGSHSQLTNVAEAAINTSLQLSRPTTWEPTEQQERYCMAMVLAGGALRHAPAACVPRLNELGDAIAVLVAGDVRFSDGAAPAALEAAAAMVDTLAQYIPQPDASTQHFADVVWQRAEALGQSSAGCEDAQAAALQRAVVRLRASLKAAFNGEP